MLEYMELETILWVLLVVIILLCIQLDRFSRRTVNYIDSLQNRVSELEERLGISDTDDLDPLGFMHNDKE